MRDPDWDSQSRSFLTPFLLLTHVIVRSDDTDDTATLGEAHLLDKSLLAETSHGSQWPRSHVVAVTESAVVAQKRQKQNLWVLGTDKTDFV